MIPQIIAKPLTVARQLTLEELKSLQFPMKSIGDVIIIEESLKGYRTRAAKIEIKLEKILAAREKGLILYILSAFLSERPAMMPYVFDNQTLVKMARHFLRHCSGSHRTAPLLHRQVHKYATWLGYSPDLIIQDLKPVGSNP